MKKQTPSTIKGHARAYAQHQGVQFTEEEFQRYYKRHLRHFGGGGSKFHMAASIVDAIRNNEREPRRRE
ncbi:MAG: hypothetical protein KDD02_09770 [Phaeodactylibacter sp.]|nr:hypothetical protein [Phaeodactylibacter sp.]MCB9302603.1 hypothetical protein [Lewinellaceae bacterium]